MDLCTAGDASVPLSIQVYCATHNAHLVLRPLFAMSSALEHSHSAILPLQTVVPVSLFLQTARGAIGVLSPFLWTALAYVCHPYAR